MPLLKTSSAKNPTNTLTTSPSPKHTFGRSKSPSKTPVIGTRDQNEAKRRGSIFSRRRQSSSTVSSATSGDNSASPHSGFFGWTSSTNHSKDPTIMAAHEKVVSAETMEKEADQALVRARMAVKEAREHVKVLEREVVQDANRARAKQHLAEGISKHAEGLGRHG